jgi:hypothetical protein
MKKIVHDNKASAAPVILFIILLGMTSLVVLLLGHVVEPFMNLIDSSDDSINPDVSAPREGMNQFIQLFWPKGLLLSIFISATVALFMEYQKKTYKEG